MKFYEALNPGGFLVLSMVESLVGAAVNAFEHVDNRLRVYRKPEDKSLTYDTKKMLSQEEIDKVVAGMIEPFDKSSGFHPERSQRMEKE